MRYVDPQAGKLSPTLASSITATLYIAVGFVFARCVRVDDAHDSRVLRRQNPRESYTFPVTRACIYVLHALSRARAIGIPRSPSGVLAARSKRRWEILPINNGKVGPYVRLSVADHRRTLIRHFLLTDAR